METALDLDPRSAESHAALDEKEASLEAFDEVDFRGLDFSSNLWFCTRAGALARQTFPGRRARARLVA